MDTEPRLCKTLAESSSLEVRRRAAELLRALDGSSQPPERLRALRSVQVLEYAGTRAARQALETLGKGAASARLTREARAALVRLERRRTAAATDSDR